VKVGQYQLMKIVAYVFIDHPSCAGTQINRYIRVKTGRNWPLVSINVLTIQLFVVKLKLKYS